jgi:hypothetical protein
MKKIFFLSISFLFIGHLAQAQTSDDDFFLFQNQHLGQRAGLWLPDSAYTYFIITANKDSLLGAKRRYLYTPEGAIKVNTTTGKTTCTTVFYTYNKQKQLEKYDYTNSNCQGENSSEETEEYSYNAVGLLQSSKRVTKSYSNGMLNDTKNSLTVYYYTGTRKDSIVSYSGTPVPLKSAYGIYKYNAKLQLEEYQSYTIAQGVSKPSSKVNYFYNDFGKLKQTISNFGTINNQNIYHYDDKQTLVLTKQFDLNQNGKHLASNEYFNSFFPSAVATKEIIKQDIKWQIPNPNSGQTINVSVANEATMSIRLLDLNGKIVEQQYIESGKSFILNTASNGLFFLQLMDQSGRLLDTKKIVLQR